MNASPKLIGPVLIAIAIVLALKGKDWADPFMQRLIVVIATLLIGPLLIVNSVFKEFIGRVRPRMIEQFGGQFDFTRAGEIMGQCQGNCSFVSGEASVGGWFLVCGLLFATHQRKLVYSLLLALGVFMALLRVAFGAHFISDVTLGFLVPVIVCALLVLLIDHLDKAPKQQKS